MQYKLHKKILCLSFILLFMNGCTTFQIVDLKPESLMSRKSEYSTNSIAGVETMHVTGGEYRDAGEWQQGLANALRDNGVFKSVSHPYIDKKNIDIIIRGEVGGEFQPNGSANFFTWWPGPLVFAHNWRGTRYIYDAHADIKVLDASTGELLGEYHAKSSHELIHKSANPGPMIAALIIVPGVIKGAMSVSPREKYRRQMYEVAYPNLWKKIATQISEDQSKKYTETMSSLQKQCGRHLDEAPEVGMLWSDFIACQTQKYRLIGQEPMKSGIVYVYTRSDRYYRVHVTKEGHIIRWFVQKKRR